MELSNNEMSSMKDVEVVLIEVFSEVSDVIQLLQKHCIHLYPGFYSKKLDKFLQPSDILQYIRHSISLVKDDLLSRVLKYNPHEINGCIFFNPQTVLLRIHI